MTVWPIVVGTVYESVCVVMVERRLSLPICVCALLMLAHDMLEHEVMPHTHFNQSITHYGEGKSSYSYLVFSIFAFQIHGMTHPQKLIVEKQPLQHTQIHTQYLPQLATLSSLCVTNEHT